MNPQRRLWLQRLATGTATASAWARPAGATPAASVLAGMDGVRPDRRLRFPQDHGAHVAQRTEWWYATGWLGTEAAPSHGWQVTFFRSATGLGQGNRSRFAPRHVLFAHAAVTDLRQLQHRHAQRMARWSGLPDAAPDVVALDHGALRVAGWSLADESAGWRVQVAADGFAFDLHLQRTQPLLLQGEAGYSIKGPWAPGHPTGVQPNVKTESQPASHYYSEPQLAVHGRLQIGRMAPGAPSLQGRAWLDHEWSDTLLPEQAVGWDWIGINLFDGSALTAFQLRRADGSVLWAGGSWRAASGGMAAQNFVAPSVAFTPGARWRSGASGADYPTHWMINTPAGRFDVRALLQAQELDSRSGTGVFYWEGLSELLNDAGHRVGLGYLEMTGYAGRLRLG